jgi:hypothetical protein
MIQMILFAAALAAAPTELRIDHAAARVVVTPARGGTLSATVTPAGAGPPLQVRREGKVLVIDGGLPEAGHGGLFDVFNGSRCKTNPAALPLITVRSPADVRITGTGALFGQVGASDSLVLDTDGCGRWRIGPVVGTLWMRVKGQTTAEVAGHAPKADLYAWGASEIRHSGEVGVLTAEVHDASTIRVRMVDGAVDSLVSGSGDIIYARPPKAP